MEGLASRCGGFVDLKCFGGIEDSEDCFRSIEQEYMGRVLNSMVV